MLSNSLKFFYDANKVIILHSLAYEFMDLRNIRARV